ncbi:unnamed protein product, partial [Linum tenue]
MHENNFEKIKAQHINHCMHAGKTPYFKLFDLCLFSRVLSFDPLAEDNNGRNGNAVGIAASRVHSFVLLAE